MLLSEREEKRKERVVAAAAAAWGDYTRWYQAKAHESVSTAV